MLALVELNVDSVSAPEHFASGRQHDVGQLVTGEVRVRRRTRIAASNLQAGRITSPPTSPGAHPPRHVGHEMACAAVGCPASLMKGVWTWRLSVLRAAPWRRPPRFASAASPNCPPLLWWSVIATSRNDS